MCEVTGCSNKNNSHWVSVKLNSLLHSDCELFTPTWKHCLANYRANRVIDCHKIRESQPCSWLWWPPPTSQCSSAPPPPPPSSSRSSCGSRPTRRQPRGSTWPCPAGWRTRWGPSSGPGTTSGSASTETWKDLRGRNRNSKSPRELGIWNRCRCRDITV